MDGLAVIEAGAFIPTMEADKPYEILEFAPGLARIQEEFWEQPNIRDYDYVLIIHPEATKVPPGLTEVARGPSFVLAEVPH